MTDYRPAAFSFADAEARIAEGRAQIIAAEDDITIYAGALEEGDTPAVCALLAWRRCAAENERRVRFADIPPRLRELIQVYQLEKILLESELFPAEDADL